MKQEGFISCVQLYSTVEEQIAWNSYTAESAESVHFFEADNNVCFYELFILFDSLWQLPFSLFLSLFCLRNRSRKTFCPRQNA
jgi:hypothetical protein